MNVGDFIIRRSGCEPCWGLFLRVRVHGMEWNGMESARTYVSYR